MRPGNLEFAGDCRRVRVKLNGENYYLTLGDDFILVTVPDENKFDRANERMLLESLCSGTTRALGGA